MLIANPTAGQGRVRWIAGLLQQALERHGAEVTLMLTGGPRDAVEATRYVVESRNFDRVVAAGGDGTINQVLGGLVHSGIPVAILPLGTANSLAREIRLPFNFMRAARIAVEGPTTKVDIGRAGNSYFLLEVSAGFDAAVVGSIRKPQKFWLGPFAYIVNGLSLLRTHAPFDLRCTVDGELIQARANMAICSNSATYVYGFRLVPGASIHDGMVDLCILDAEEHPFRWQVVAALFNRLGPRVGARTIKGRHIHMESNPPAVVQIDGDPAGTTPIDIECIPDALDVVVTPRYLRRLSRARKVDEILPAGAGSVPDGR